MFEVSIKLVPKWPRLILKVFTNNNNVNNTRCTCYIVRSMAANSSLSHFYSEVTVTTGTQSVSRPDGESAPREDLDSPEC